MRVEAGQVVARIDERAARLRSESLKAQKEGVRAERTRLRAERSLALGLNERGQVVGWSAIGTSARAVLWDVNGVSPTVTALFNSSSVALSINNSGEIVGRNNDVGFHYRNGAVTTLPGAFGPRCGVAINEGGDIVGGNATNFLFYLNGQSQTQLVNTFFPSSFAGEQRIVEVRSWMTTMAWPATTPTSSSST